MSHRNLVPKLLRDTAIGSLAIVAAYLLGPALGHLLGGIA